MSFIETYEYDYQGNRTSKKTGDITFDYTVDLSSGYSQVLKATNGTDTVYYTRGFELISRHEGDAASYYLYDGGLSVRALTDEAGAITDTLVFDAFGNETEKAGTTANTYGFQGEEQDATGLYYLRARYMDPDTGTFTSMDTYAGSLSDPMSLHKYLFANSNPVMYSDPSGLFSLVEFELSEAIDEIIMSSLSFGMAYIGMVKDNPNMSDTEKFAGYLAALGLGALFPFGIALIHAMFSILVAGVILATLSLVLSLISRGIDYEKHPTVAALLKISAGATFAAALASLGNAFAGNARRAQEAIRKDQETTEKLWHDENYKEDGSPRWPKNDGFEGAPKQIVLEEGTYFDRYGNTKGSYASPEFTPYEERSLAPRSYERGYHVYRIRDGHSLTVKAGKTASAFGKPGGGIQYKFDYSIQEMLDFGWIEEVY